MILAVPMGDVRIRRAETTDLNGLLSLFDELAGDRSTAAPAGRAASEPVLELILRDPMRHLMVAVLDERVVGTAEVIILPNLTHHAQPWAVVENVAVSESERRGGIGRALMEDIIELARAAGCYKLQLQSGKQRSAAHEFYAALGFEPVSEGFKIYFDA